MIGNTLRETFRKSQSAAGQVVYCLTKSKSPTLNREEKLPDIIPTFS